MLLAQVGEKGLDLRAVTVVEYHGHTLAAASGDLLGRREHCARQRCVSLLNRTGRKIRRVFPGSRERHKGVLGQVVCRRHDLFGPAISASNRCSVSA